MKTLEIKINIVFLLNTIEFLKFIIIFILKKVLFIFLEFLKLYIYIYI